MSGLFEALIKLLSLPWLIISALVEGIVEWFTGRNVLERTLERRYSSGKAKHAAVCQILRENPRFQDISQDLFKERRFDIDRVEEDIALRCRWSRLSAEAARHLRSELQEVLLRCYAISFAVESAVLRTGEPVSPSLPATEPDLTRLWQRCRPGRSLDSAEGWQEVGFQRPSGDGDFRSTGRLGLLCVVDFAERYPRVAAEALDRMQLPDRGFPWACGSINVTAQVLARIRRRSPSWDGFLLPVWDRAQRKSSLSSLGGGPESPGAADWVGAPPSAASFPADGGERAGLRKRGLPHASPAMVRRARTSSTPSSALLPSDAALEESAMERVCALHHEVFLRLHARWWRPQLPSLPPRLLGAAPWSEGGEPTVLDFNAVLAEIWRQIDTELMATGDIAMQ